MTPLENNENSCKNKTTMGKPNKEVGKMVEKMRMKNVKKSGGVLKKVGVKGRTNGMSRMSIIGIMYGRIRFKLWSRKIKNEMEEIRKNLIKTEFNDGRDVEWADYAAFGGYTLGMEDVDGKKHGIWVGRENSRKNNGVYLEYSEMGLGGRELDIRVVKGGYTEDLQDEVRRFKKERDSMRKVRDYYIQEIGYDVAQIDYGKKGEDITYHISFHERINGCYQSPENFETGVRNLGLELKEWATGSRGREIKDTEGNEKILANLVKGYSENHNVSKYEKDKKGKQITGMVVKIPGGI